MQYIKKAEKLHSLESLKRSWQKTSIDIIRLLPKSKRLDTIVIMVDWFTKMIRLKATMTIVSSEEIAKIYRDKIWKLYRVLQKILSNKELQFTSKFMEDLTKALKTKRILSTAYHSQTDVQIEQIN